MCLLVHERDLMIHRVHSTSLAEINRVLELIQKPVVEVAQPVAVAKKRLASTGATASVSATISTSASTSTSTGGSSMSVSAPVMSAGADTDIEVLVDNNGNVLTDERGYALLGVKVSSTIMTGVGDTAVEVLSGS